MKQPAVYIMASERNGTLYIGVTSDLVQRVWQHRNDAAQGFTQQYNVHSLVYFEQHQDMLAAIQREKQLKRWNRSWKINLIQRDNPTWRDLWDDIVGAT
jgi:putative endonuclease